MVACDRGTPEGPDNSTSRNLENNGEIIMPNDTDSDEDGQNYTGYQPLPLSPEEALGEDSDEETSHSNSDNFLDEQSLPPITRAEETLVRDVWTNSLPKDIEMDSSKVNEVKQAMMGITLPDSSIPEWASKIPEEAWKERLLNRIQNRNRQQQ